MQSFVDGLRHIRHIMHMKEVNGKKFVICLSSMEGILGMDMLVIEKTTTAPSQTYPFHFLKVLKKIKNAWNFTKNYGKLIMNWRVAQ